MKNALKVFKRNKWKCIGISFFVAFILGYLSISTPIKIHNDLTTHIPFLNSMNLSILDDTITYITNIKSTIMSYTPTRGILANLFNNITASNSFLFGILNSFNQLVFNGKVWESFIILIGALITFLFWLLVLQVLVVGQKRFYIENKNYSKTNFKSLLLPFRLKEYSNIAIVMFYKNIREYIWYLTIIGGFIKHYAYSLVPYLLAEDPRIGCKKAVSLSNEMMKGHKKELFKIDLSLLIFDILDILTFHLVGILFSNPYKECVKAEFYMNLRKKYKNEYNYDKYLDKEGDKYPYDKFKYDLRSNKWLNIDYNQNYSILSYIFMFFCTSIVGWIWEVSLHLFQYGSFVNRGTLHGPWLQIYGFGGIILLILLKKVRKNPVLTFILSMLVCGIIEYSTAWYLETFKHARWWDYDGFFLNIQGRVCLEALIAFGIGGILFIYFGAPLLQSIFKKIKPIYQKILCTTLVIIFSIDFIYSSIYPNMGEGVTTDYYENSTTLE